MHSPSDNKRRPSIQLSPSMDQPVYILSKYLNGIHILILVEQLQRNNIPYQLQQQHNTLGYALDRRFFVVFDNKYGEVSLGTDFSCKLMTVVGYPRMGRNKNNRYCKTPQEIVKEYREYARRPCTVFDDCDGIKQEQEEQSEQTKKIEVKSIIKYNGQASLSSGESWRKGAVKDAQESKLVIYWDSHDGDYSRLCYDLFVTHNTPSMQKMDNMRQVRQNQKTTAATSSTSPYYYLVNQTHCKQMLAQVVGGQVIVYCSESKKVTIKQVVDQPKIYAVVCDGKELYKVLERIGIGFEREVNKQSGPINVADTRKQTKMRIQIQKLSDDAKNDIQQVAQSPRVATQKSRFAKQQSSVQSKQVTSITPKTFSNENNETSLDKMEANKDQLGQMNSSGPVKGRKIKRLKGAKSGIKDREPSATKQNRYVKEVERETSPQRKKTIRTEVIASKSKKYLTFKDDVFQPNKQVLKLKLLCQPAPETVYVQESQTQIDQPKYANTYPTDLMYSNSGSFSGFFSFSGSFYNSTSQGVHAILYRDFVPCFIEIVNTLKTNPKALQLGPIPPIYGFISIKQYDHFVRRVKNRIRQQNPKLSQFNFIVLLGQNQVQKFMQYCQLKNRTYDNQQEALNTAQSDKFSCLSAFTTRINVNLFVQGHIQEGIRQFGRIKVYAKSIQGNVGKNYQQMKQQIFSAADYIPSMHA